MAIRLIYKLDPVDEALDRWCFSVGCSRYAHPFSLFLVEASGIGYTIVRLGNGQTKLPHQFSCIASDKYDLRAAEKEIEGLLSKADLEGVFCLESGSKK